MLCIRTRSLSSLRTRSMQARPVSWPVSGPRRWGPRAAALAGTLGRCDGEVTRDEALDHARAIVDAVDLPVSADLENGFGHEPEAAAKTVTQAAEAGLVGCTIEDFTGDTDRPFYDRDLAAERIAAAAEAARSAGFRFTLTARSECFIRGLPDLDEVIARLQAYERAGADVLMAPALPDMAAVGAVCRAVSKPVNFMVGVTGKSFPVADLSTAGVRRISLATSLYRAAMSGIVAAATEAMEEGTFFLRRRCHVLPGRRRLHAAMIAAFRLPSGGLLGTGGARRSGVGPRGPLQKGDVGAPDMVRPLDRQVAQQIWVNPVLRLQRAGARRPIDCLKPHQARRACGPMAPDPHALAAQVQRNPTSAAKRVLQERLVDAAHRRQRLGALPLRLVVERGTSDRQQAALPAQAQRRVIPHNHRAALRPAHRADPRDKKSRSTISSPILA